MLNSFLSSWNSLPISVKTSTSVDVFEADLEHCKREHCSIGECSFWDVCVELCWTELGVHLVLIVKRYMVPISLTAPLLPESIASICMDLRPL